MNQTHIHLLINHLPLFGSILGGCVLAYGLWTKSNQTKIAAYLLFIVSAIGALIAYLTGEAAEETVENIQGITKNIVEQHEEFSLIALISVLALGVVSIGGIILTWKKSSWTRNFEVIVLFISLISFGLVGRTAYLGGQIRHTEINSAASVNGQSQEREDDD